MRALQYLGALLGAAIGAVGTYLMGSALGPGSASDRLVGLLFFGPYIAVGVAILAAALVALRPLPAASSSRRNRLIAASVALAIGLLPGGIPSLLASFVGFWLALRPAI